MKCVCVCVSVLGDDAPLFISDLSYARQVIQHAGPRGGLHPGECLCVCWCVSVISGVCVSTYGLFYFFSLSRFF